MAGVKKTFKLFKVADSDRWIYVNMSKIRTVEDISPGPGYPSEAKISFNKNEWLCVVGDADVLVAYMHEDE